MVSIKTRMRVLRAKRESSQARLAAETGVTRQTINSVENGRYHPTLLLAFKVARSFRKRIEEVFSARMVRPWIRAAENPDGTISCFVVLHAQQEELPPVYASL